MNKNQKKHFLATVFIFFLFSAAKSQPSLPELLSYPYPSNLCASPTSGKLAWTFDIQGKRNIFLSEDNGKSFTQLTNNEKDDGQVISDLQFSPDGNWLIYIKGGEPDGNWSTNKPVDPLSIPENPGIQLWSLHLPDKKEVVLAADPDSYTPAISPQNDRVAFVKDGAIWVAPLDGSTKAKKLFYARGSCSDPTWSPDSKLLAFVSFRGSHSFIGIYKDEATPIHWIDPSFSRDSSPEWSPGGDSIVFIRRKAAGGAPDSLLSRQPNPWEIRTADIEGKTSHLVWASPHTFNGSVPTTSGSYNLHWGADNRILFLATLDNWPHLYSIAVNGGTPLLLTPGNFMTEYIRISPDRRKVVFAANTGPDKLDIDRRHIGIVSIATPDMTVLTPGDGIEARPVFVDDTTVGFISSTPFRPALPAVIRIKERSTQIIGTSLLSPVYNDGDLVKPTQVIFKAPDGTPVHGQLFTTQNDNSIKKPAVVCIHGGPMRQMLLGWNYSDYYAAHYAVNQWLATHGYVVLSVNYRLGIGYGNRFHHPPGAGRAGASEYQDILAAGEWLAKQSFVDPKRIGVYGGSYGGYLTAFSLGKNSNIFAAGVDISGVHDVTPREKFTAKFEHAPDAHLADTMAWKSSPVADVNTWVSPVLLIHADDDRNVDFDESINLLNRLLKKGVTVETLVIPDDTHHWLKFSNLLNVYESTIDFLNRKLRDKK